MDDKLSKEVAFCDSLGEKEVKNGIVNILPQDVGASSGPARKWIDRQHLCEIAGISVLIVVVWILLAVPIVLYHLPVGDVNIKLN